MFTSFPIFCSFTNTPRYHQLPTGASGCWDSLGDGYKKPCMSVRTQNRDGPRLFTSLAWIQLDIGTHVRCGFLDVPNKLEMTQTTSLRLCLSLWWIVIILQELNREHDIGTGVQSAHIQMGFQRESLSFALNGSSWTISRPNLTLEYAMLYTCGAGANELCQTPASSLSVAQIIYKLGNSTTDVWEVILAANTFMIASAMSLNTVEWFSLDPIKLRKSNWRSIP